MRAALPNFDEMACRDAQGRPARVGDMTLMCTNNPAWMQWRIDQGKRAIDLGADAIQLDTPMASSFESGFLRAGFCPYCMANFRDYLYHRFTQAQLATKFGLSDWDPDSIIARLSPLQISLIRSAAPTTTPVGTTCSSASSSTARSRPASIPAST